MILTKDKILKLEKMIKASAKPEMTAMCWYNSGNLDDAYELGQKVGEANLAYAIGELLEIELPEQEESNFDNYGK